MLSRSSEFSLLLKLCTSGTYEVLRNDIELVDWGKFIRLCEEHKLGPIVFTKILHLSLPDDIKIQIRELLFANKIYMFDLFRELGVVTKKLGEFDIQICSQKGPVLAEMIYGDVTLRYSKDLDIVVDKEKLDRTIEILLSLGYVLVDIPYKTIKQKEVYQNVYQECTLFNSEKEIEIDLHWLFYAPAIFENSIDDFVELSEYDKIDGLRIMSKHDELIYLCFHGGRHRWFRLIWVYDIYTYLQLFSSEELKLVINKSNKMEVSKFLLEGVYLAHVLFGYSIPDFIRPLCTQKIISLSNNSKWFIKRTESNMKLSYEPLLYNIYGRLKKIKSYYLLGGIKMLVRREKFLFFQPKLWAIFSFSDRFFFLNYLLVPFLFPLLFFKRKN